jgi:hypothetical protein
MPVAARFASEEVYVLADPAEVRIIVLRHESDSERTCGADASHRE